MPHNVDFDNAPNLRNDVSNGNDNLSSATTTFVITDGPNAVHHFEFSRGQCVDHAGAVKVERVEEISDTIGAGDSFVAGYLSAQLKGSGVRDSIEEGVRRMRVLRRLTCYNLLVNLHLDWVIFTQYPEDTVTRTVPISRSEQRG